MIALLAVIFVPLLYAGMFLWAFWDPYHALDDIPVAIVNKDQAYEYEGELFEIGKELVEELKDEDAFEFHFVDEDKGYQGLEDEDYYILIEIPEDFSKNATTLMDPQPDKLRLKYVPNESYNFLAAQIGETAMLQIEQALEEKIIQTFSETIFEKIDEVAEGLGEAEEATKDLDGGADELRKNTHLLKDHLRDLADSSIVFVEATDELSSGSRQLAEGTLSLEDGLVQLYDASGKLLQGSQQLKKGTEDLHHGISQAQLGVKKIDENFPSLLDGTNQLSLELQEAEYLLAQGLAKDLGLKLEEAYDQINKGLSQLEQGVIKGLGASSQEEKALANQLARGLSEEINRELSKLGEQAKALTPQLADDLAKSLAKEVVRQQEDLVDNLALLMGQVGIEEDQRDLVLQGLTSQLPKEDHIQAALSAQIQAAIIEDLQGLDALLSQKEQELEKSIEAGVYGAILQTEEKVAAGFLEFNTGLSQALEANSADLADQVSAGIKPAFTALQQGVDQVQAGQRALQSGLHELGQGTEQLVSGADSLALGQQEYTGQFQTFRNKFSEAKEGVHLLSDGSLKVEDGMGQLAEGSRQLKGGSEALAEGSVSLAEGTDRLKEGTAEFSEEMSKAAEEAKEVETSESTHDMMANPVEVENKKINEVPNYGTGFAPYFISLGLYVGALLLSIVYPLRAQTIPPRSGFNWFLRKTSGLAVIGILQAVLVSMVLLYGLKIEVQSVPLFYLYAIITSWTFLALIQFLVTCFDDPGRFVAILILILQLTTSAGTFPLELIPKVLQPFNAFLPMTYTVKGFKAVISSGNYAVMGQTVGVLALFTLVCSLLTLTYFVLMFKKRSAMMKENVA